MNSGSSHSLDAPNTYPTITNAQQEPTIHNAIDRDYRKPLHMRPLRALVKGIAAAQKPSRPIGVISPKALKGEPHPLPYIINAQLSCKRHVDDRFS